jgi:imidazolonepropionase-like amidohydrolase
VITNVKILDGTGREPFPGEVVVDGNRITAVTTAIDGQPGSRATSRRRHRHRSARAGTLMPGLIEAATRTSAFPICSRTTSHGLPVEEHMLTTVRNARTMLDCGYTSAFSAASAKTPARRGAQARDRSGPRSGPAPARQRPRDHRDGRPRRHERDAPAL